eukprot:3492895-Rhodomonas_salina.1
MKPQRCRLVVEAMKISEGRDRRHCSFSALIFSFRSTRFTAPEATLVAAPYVSAGHGIGYGEGRVIGNSGVVVKR